MRKDKEKRESLEEARSPLKEQPLRLPGQSLDDKREQLVDEVLLPYILFPAVFWIVALLEWVLALQHAPHQPTLFAAAAVVLTIVAAARIWRLRPTVVNLRLGRDGERVVGQALEELRIDGAKVFHDIPAKGFNLDHVIVMRQGVFVIETKTWSKRGRNPTISTSEGQLYKYGFPVNPNPIDQASSEADWLRQVLQKLTNKNYPVKAVVLFPGWWVERMDQSTKEIAWVLNPISLPSFLAREAALLDDADVALVADRIALHVRSQPVQ